MNRFTITMVATALCLISASATAAETERTGDALGGAEYNDATCKVLGTVFRRLADQRDNRVRQKVAEFRVSRWLEEKGLTGSHVKSNYQKSTQAAADVVYRHASMNPTVLYYYGRRSCEAELMFGAEPMRRTAAQVLLLKAAESCQDEHGNAEAQGAVRDCLAQAAADIHQRVKTARIESPSQRPAGPAPPTRAPR